MLFVRKNTKLRIAYGLLSFTTLAVIARDATLRSAPTLFDRAARPGVHHESALPLAMTRLTDSPFPEARPSRGDANIAIISPAENRPAPKRGKTSAPSKAYFLTVAIRVASGTGTVSFNRGTRVFLVEEQDGKFRVRHHQTDFLIEKSQVTDDLNALTALARAAS